MTLYPKLRIELRTTADVIDALGGGAKVARLTKRSPSAVSNWRVFETLPSDTYVVMQTYLKKRGFSAPDSLWRMTPLP